MVLDLCCLMAPTTSSPHSIFISAFFSVSPLDPEPQGGKGLIWYPAYHLAYFSGAWKEHFLLNDQIVERGKQLCEFSLFPRFTETRVERGNLSKASCKVAEGDESPSPSGRKASLSLWPSPAPCPLQPHHPSPPGPPSCPWHCLPRAASSLSAAPQLQAPSTTHSQSHSP